MGTVTSVKDLLFGIRRSDNMKEYSMKDVKVFSSIPIKFEKTRKKLCVRINKKHYFIVDRPVYHEIYAEIAIYLVLSLG